MSSNSYSPQILEKIKSIKKVRKKYKIGIPGNVPEKYQKSAEKVPREHRKHTKSAGKVRKKYGNNQKSTKI